MCLVLGINTTINKSRLLMSDEREIFLGVKDFLLSNSELKAVNAPYDYTYDLLKHVNDIAVIAPLNKQSIQINVPVQFPDGEVYQYLFTSKLELGMHARMFNDSKPTIDYNSYGNDILWLTNIPILIENSDIQLAGSGDIVVSNLIIPVPEIVKELFPHYPYSTKYKQIWNNYLKEIYNKL